ncbi:MAG: HAD family hydrolase [Patescibacteria group bacterium]
MIRRGGRSLDSFLPSIYAAILDVDGTLYEGNSWVELTEGLSDPDKIESNVAIHLAAYSSFAKNEMTFDQAMKIWVDLWNGLGISEEKAEEIFEQLKPKEWAKELVHFLNDWGVVCCILTGSLEEFAKVFAGTLGVSRYLANARFNWDKRTGELVSFDYFPDQAARKHEQLSVFLEELSQGRSRAGLAGVDFDNCLVIGDGPNDYEVFKAAGLAIAIINPEKPDEGLISLAHICVDNLAEALDALTTIRMIQVMLRYPDS